MDEQTDNGQSDPYVVLLRWCHKNHTFIILCFVAQFELKGYKRDHPMTSYHEKLKVWRLHFERTDVKGLSGSSIS